MSMEQQKMSLDTFRERVESEIVCAYRSNVYNVNFAMAYMMKDLYKIHERYLETQNCTDLQALVMAEDMFLNQLEDIAKRFQLYVKNGF